MDTLKILIVDDEQLIRDELTDFLTTNQYKVFQAALPSAAFEMVRAHAPDIVILDLKLPEMDGLDVLARLKQETPDQEVILITGHGDMESVIQALRLGASDYLSKPFQLMDVQAAIERTRKFLRVQQRLKTVELNYTLLSKAFAERVGMQLVGSSPAFKAMLELMTRVAEADTTTVLITGESGTGKELVARGIHALSARNAHPFYAVNVSAIPVPLFESEFFGHTKGTFTGADEEKLGWFEIARNSTLFLDEISELDLNLQVKLLRVLEEKRIIRLGTHREIPVNVRLMAATNTNLDQLMQTNMFRADLYHRLNAFEIRVPPLRERPEDIPLLVEHFIELYARSLNKPLKRLEPDVLPALLTYRFPGNVRELKNMLERAMIVCDGPSLGLRHFPLISQAEPVAAAESGFDLSTMEKRLILQALRLVNGNKTHAATLLGITRQSLNRRLQKFGGGKHDV